MEEVNRAQRGRALSALFRRVQFKSYNVKDSKVCTSFHREALVVKPSATVVKGEKALQGQTGRFEQKIQKRYELKILLPFLEDNETRDTLSALSCVNVLLGHDKFLRENPITGCFEKLLVQIGGQIIARQ